MRGTWSVERLAPSSATARLLVWYATPAGRRAVTAASPAGDSHTCAAADAREADSDQWPTCAPHTPAASSTRSAGAGTRVMMGEGVAAGWVVRGRYRNATSSRTGGGRGLAGLGDSSPIQGLSSPGAAHSTTRTQLPVVASAGTQYSGCSAAVGTCGGAARWLVVVAVVGAVAALPVRPASVTGSRSFPGATGTLHMSPPADTAVATNADAAATLPSCAAPSRAVGVPAAGAGASTTPPTPPPPPRESRNNAPAASSTAEPAVGSVAAPTSTGVTWHSMVAGWDTATRVGVPPPGGITHAVVSGGGGQ